MNYYVTVEGQVAGPLAIQEVVDLFVAGALTGSSQITEALEDGAFDWKRLDVLLPGVSFLPTRGQLLAAIEAIEVKAPPPPKSAGPSLVTVTNLDISFANLFALLIKVSIAAIPAAIVLAVVYLVALSILQSLFR